MRQCGLILKIARLLGQMSTDHLNSCLEFGAMNPIMRSLRPGRRWKSHLAAGVALTLALADIVKAADAPPTVTPLPPLSAYQPTSQNEAALGEFIYDVLTFMMFHEMGHMVFHEYNVPVGSKDTEESAADSFAAALMISSSARAQHNGLVAAALYWDASHRLQQTNAPGQYDWADVHAPNEQRAYKLACLLYGANPQAFASIAERFDLQGRRDACVADSAKNLNDWGSIIKPNLNPEAGKPFDPWTPRIAVLYHQVPTGLPNGFGAALSHARQIVLALEMLDFVGNELLSLKKTSRDAALDLVQRALDAKKLREEAEAARSRPPVRLGDLSLGGPVIVPNPDHPAEGAPLQGYNYTVIGDSCLRDKGEPWVNAYWDSAARSITLCYGLVAEIEYVGRRLLAESR